MWRRDLLLAGSVLTASRALAQPVPLIGPVGGRPAAGGPLWSLNAGPPGVALDLNFMTMSGVLDPHITFTRASTARYFNSAGTLQAAATNAPRFDYNPSTLQPNGLLIEEARTNVAPVSVPDTTNWTQTNATLTINSAIAPDGTTTATLAVDNATSGSHTLTAVGTFSYVSGTNYSFSIFAKAASARGLQVFTAGAPFATNPYANFDLTSGTVGTSAGVGASMQNVGNGWWRCTMVGLASSSTSATSFVVCLTGNNNSAVRSVSYVGSGTGLYIWGAQTEAGAFPTSYIPTAGAAATRAADVATLASIPGRNATAESFQAEFTLQALTASQNPRVVANAASQSAPLFVNSTLHGSTTDLVGTVASANALTLGAVAKLAANWATPNAGRLCLNAGTVAGATTLTAGFSGIGTIRLMGDSAAADTANGYMRRFRYWSRVLADTELQSVTT